MFVTKHWLTAYTKIRHSVQMSPRVSWTVKLNKIGAVRALIYLHFSVSNWSFVALKKLRCSHSWFLKTWRAKISRELCLQGRPFIFCHTIVSYTKYHVLILLLRTHVNYNINDGQMESRKPLLYFLKPLKQWLSCKSESLLNVFADNLILKRS